MRGKFLTKAIAALFLGALFIGAFALIRGASAGNGPGSTLWGHYHVSVQQPLCQFSGGPGWQNVVLPGGNGAEITSDSTAQDCCNSCVADTNCAQWAFVGGSCLHNIPPDQCIGTPTSIIDSGNIRCPSSLFDTSSQQPLALPQKAPSWTTPKN